MLVKMKLM